VRTAHAPRLTPEALVRRRQDRCRRRQAISYDEADDGEPKRSTLPESRAYCNHKQRRSKILGRQIRFRERSRRASRAGAESKMSRLGGVGTGTRGPFAG